MNEMINDRDMIYGGYYQNIPGNMQYGNFGFQGMPGSLMYGNMGMPNMMNNYNNDIFAQINSRLTSLENRIKLIEQRLGNNTSYVEDNNSMYMI